MKDYVLKKETKEVRNRMFMRMFGITWDQFKLLDDDKQQELVRNYNESHPEKESDKVRIMIGEGDSAEFRTFDKGARVRIGSGRNLVSVRAGETAKEQMERLESETLSKNGSIRRLIKKLSGK